MVLGDAQTLAAIRNAPLAMRRSNELRVRDAEHFVEASS